VAPSPEKFDSSARFCPVCGSPANRGDRFCTRCGSWISVGERIARKQLQLQGVNATKDRERSFTERAMPDLPGTRQRKLKEEEAAHLERPFHEIRKEVESSGLDFQKDLPEAVIRILSSKRYYVVKYKLLEEHEAEYATMAIDEVGVDHDIASALEKLGIQRLYRFQEEAVLSVVKGENVVVAAPTGNGKTLAFAVPVFQMIMQDKKNYNVDDRESADSYHCKTLALFIYPTKALARDQLSILQKLGGSLEKKISIEVFDGDTQISERERILKKPPDVIISNFDTVEYHLRSNTSFSQILRTVKIVVVDELHTYVGAFGTHVHFILRRLKRVLREPGALQLIGSSATIGNPKQFAEQLFNSNVTEIKCENGTRGRIHFIMLYPTKTSMTGMIVECVRSMLSSGMKTLVFANTHKNAEVLNLALRHSGIQSDIHRAGLLKNYRTEIEESFKSGRLKALVATPTLELGIDIGDLDSVVSMITGITNLTQRMGRAGRKGQESVVILAMRGEDPISAFYKNHPDTYFADISPAYVEPKNPIIARLELLAASMDRPISQGEFQEFSHLLNRLVKEKLLLEKMGILWPTAEARKMVSQMNIRGIGETVAIFDVTVEDNPRRIGERQLPMALRELFPKSVYLLAGRKYESVSFEKIGGLLTAKVRRLPDSHPYKTEALRSSLPLIIEVHEVKRVKGVEVKYCTLSITEVVEGYVVKEIFSDKEVGSSEMLSKPLSYTYQTKGFVFCAPKPLNTVSSPLMKSKEIEDSRILGGSFHALEHALIESSDSLTGSGSSEVGGVSMGDSGVIFVYDGSPGGSGLTKLLYDRLEDALERTFEILKECKCTSTDGCPLCTYSYQCGNNNEPLNKVGAIESLQRILSNSSRTQVKELNYNERTSYL
jgi:DEAD/DEAH box helicase domain-containing protein